MVINLNILDCRPYKQDILFFLDKIKHGKPEYPINWNQESWIVDIDNRTFELFSLV
jgi:hypothetical protein